MTRLSRILMVRVDGGGGSTAAADAAARAAEEARQRAAEAARRAAEEARKAAEAAEKARREAEAAQRKAAEEAEKAAAAQAAADKAKSDPKSNPTQIEAAQKAADTQRTKAETAARKADEATQVAKTKAEEAKVAMNKANELATKQNQPAPFTNQAISNLTKQDVFEAKPATEALKESLADKAAKIPAEVQKRLGLTDEDVAAIKDEAIPHLKKAADQLLAGKPEEAIASLADAAKAGAGEAAERAIMRAAEKLPETGVKGIARELLTDPAVVKDLVNNPDVRGAISKLGSGDLEGALKDIAKVPSIQDNVINQLKESPQVKGALSKIGLELDDLDKAKGALPELIDAGILAGKGEYKAALEKLGEAAQDPGVREIISEAVTDTAAKLKTTGAEGMARSLLTNKEFVDKLLDSPEAGQALSQLASGKTNEAIQTLAGDTDLMESAVGALSTNADFKKGMDKLGLTADGLKKAADALPDLLKAVDSAGKGNIQEAIGFLADAGAKAPEAVAELVNKAAKNLPEGAARTLLQDKKFVENLFSNPETASAIKDLAAGRLEEGVKKLAGNEDAAKAAVDALAKDPKFKAGMDKLGLTADSLKKGVDALPDLVDAVAAANKNDFAAAVGHLADAAQKAPEVGAELINNAAKKMQDGPAKALLQDKKFVEALLSNPDTASAIKDFASGKVEDGLRKIAGNEAAATAAVDALFKDPSVKAGAEKLGLTPEALKKGVDALPDLLEAAISANKGNLNEAIGHLADAAQKAPELGAEIINNAAKKMQDGPAKALLQDKAFVEKLLANPDTAAAIKDFAGGKVEDGLRKLAGNEEASKAAVDALFKDPSFKAGAEKLGITQESLKKGVDALPDLVEAGIAAGKNDFQKALGHLADAAVKAPELVADIVTTAAKKLPDGPAKTLLTDRAFVEKLVGNPETASAIKDFAAEPPRISDGLKKLASNGPAAEAAIDALAKDPKFKGAMDKLGLTPEAMKKAVDALPDLVDAATAASKNDFAGAIGHLADAAQKAPEAVGEIINTAAKKLPEGPARALLTDKAFVEKLVGNPETAAAIKDLANGNVAEGLRKLANNPDAGQAAVDALYKDPKFKASLDKLGVTPEQLKQGIGALPSVVEAGIAASENRWADAVGHLADAAQKAPDLVAAAINKVAQKLPPGMTRDLLTDKDFVAKLAADPNATQAIKDFSQGKLADGIKNLSQSEEAAKAAVDVLAKNPSFKSGMEKLGLTAEDLKNGVDALPDLVDAGLKASSGDFTGALKSMVDAAKKAPEIVSAALAKAATKLSDSGPEGLLKSILSDPAATTALLTDEKLHGGLKKLIDGDLSGLKDIGTSPAMGAVVDALSKNKDIQDGLAKFGLNIQDLKSATKALPDLIKGLQAMGTGDFQTAFSSLKDAALNMPPSLIEKAIKTGASHLPNELPGSILKSLLTDDKFVHELITNPDLHDSFKQAMSGDLTKAAEGILGNPAFRDTAADALAKNTDLMAKLGKVGINTAQDLKDCGAALVDVLQAGEKLKDGDLGGALSELGEGFSHLPPDMKSKLVEKFADAVNLPDGAKDVLVAVAGALGDPEVRGSLGDAFKALGKAPPDIGGFVSGVAAAGRHLMANDKTAALALVNSLKHLPGTLGKFFDDEEFNKALVDSGAAEEMFSAVEKMANGDISGALGDVMSAGGKLLTQEPHFEIAGQELPIGMQGLENMARLAKNFFDVLPSSLKEKIAEQAGKAAGKSLIKSIPFIGNVFSGISAIGSGKDLIDALGKDPKDWVEVGLNAAQLGLDIAGTIPGLGNALTGTLGNIVGMGKVVYGAANLISDMKSFQEDLVGF